MTTQTKTVFIADDGKEFDTIEECERYEKTLKDNEAVLIAWNTITAYCNSRSCAECVFADNKNDCQLQQIDVPLNLHSELYK